MDRRTEFYNIRNALDKAKSVEEAVGALSAARYLPLIPDLSGKVILDAGFGTAWLTRHMLTLGPAFVYGVDISSDRVAELESHFADRAAQGTAIEHDVRAGSIESLDFIPDASVDFVNCRDVIEHVSDPRPPLAEFFRVLRPGGRLLMQTPNGLVHVALNANHLFAQLLHFAFHGQAMPGGDDPLLFHDSLNVDPASRQALEAIAAEGIHEHERLFDPDELIALAEAQRFCVIAMDGTPLFASIFHKIGPDAPALTGLYRAWAGSAEAYKTTLNAIGDDLNANGRMRPAIRSLPVRYLLADDLILLAEKPR